MVYYTKEIILNEVKRAYARPNGLIDPLRQKYKNVLRDVTDDLLSVDRCEVSIHKARCALLPISKLFVSEEDVAETIMGQIVEYLSI